MFVWTTLVWALLVDWLFQMTAAETAHVLAPTTVLVRCDDSFTVSAELRWRRPAAAETNMQSVICQVWRGKTAKMITASFNCIHCQTGSQWRLHTQYWCDVVKLSCAGHNARCLILCCLEQLLQQTTANAVPQAVAVVQGIHSRKTTNSNKLVDRWYVRTTQVKPRRNTHDIRLLLY